MKDQLGVLWVYLETTPLLGLGATLIAYQLGLWANRRLGGFTLANPVLIAILLLMSLLLATGTPYDVFFQGAQYVHFLLGPATVALAVPMYLNLRRIRKAAHAILPAILIGSTVASVSAMVIARLLGASHSVVLSLAAKSVTTPIAMGIAQNIGGEPSLTAVFVMLTGLSGVILIGPVMRLARIRDWRAHGLAAGTAAHGMATARVLTLNEMAGAFGGLAIGINGVLAAIVVPILARYFG